MRSTRTIRTLAVVVTVGWAMPTVAVGQPAGQSPQSESTQWTKFRGPDAGAVPDDPRLPDTWSETTNVTW